MAGKNSVFTDYSAPAVDAAWLNIIQTEENNVITTSGQSLSDSALDQQAISIASYAAQGGVFAVDSGTANTYVLTQVSPFKAPHSFKNGLTIRFRAGNANTGASTVNVFGLGVKNIKQSDGSSNLESGMITTNADVIIRYDYSLGVFILSGTATQYNVGTASGNIPLIGTQSATNILAGLSYLPSPITIANNSSNPNTQIDFLGGNTISSDKLKQIVASAMTKTLQSSGAWSAGNGGNMLLSGARANSSTYHLFTISKADGTTDFGALLGIAGTSPDPSSVLPSGYVNWARVASILTDVSGNIISFVQNGKTFSFAGSPSVDLNNASQTNNTETLRNLSCPVGIVIQVLCKLNIVNTTSSSGVKNFKHYSPSITTTTLPDADFTAFWTYDSSSGAVYNNSSILPIFTNSSSQIKTNSKTLSGSPSANITLVTYGWIDYQL